MFGMGTGGTSSLGSPKACRNFVFKILNIDGRKPQCSLRERDRILLYVQSRFYGQAERAISNGQLNVLLRLHTRPINVVVFHGPS